MVNRMAYAAQERLLTVRETASLLGCSVATVWRKTSERHFPQPIKIGGMTRWSQGEVAAFIEDAKASREAA